MQLIVLGLSTVFDTVVAEVNSILFAEPLFFQTARFTASEKKQTGELDTAVLQVAAFTYFGLVS